MKWSGIIGFATTVETRPGIWEPQIVEKSYKGDIIRDTGMNQTSGQVNSDVNISNVFSIIANAYASQNFPQMLYLTYRGIKWRITNVDITPYPRIKITVGGVYNG